MPPRQFWKRVGMRKRKKKLNKMADLGNLETETIKNGTQAEVPWRFDGRYSQEERQVLKDFMHADFPHLNYGGGRYKDIIIEYPPEEICSQEEWKEILDKVFIPEWQTFDPKLKRKWKTIIRFVPVLYDNKLNTSAGGNFTKQEGEDWGRINYIDEDGEKRNIQTITFILMHEFAETDFWSKTSPTDKEAHVDLAEEEVVFKNDKQTYRYLLDEKIANRRALKAIHRMWPNANYTNPEWEYDEDKNEEVIKEK